MATTNDDMQKSVKAAEAESAKASETRVTASETTAPVNSDARAVAEPTAPASKDAPAVANTQDAQPNLNAEEVQAEVDAELEALFAEADADEIPDAAQEVLLAQADDSADDAPAEEGKGEGESADGSAAGDGAMGAGQIGLIGLGLAAAAAAGGGGGSSSPSTDSSSEETGDITSSTTSAVTDNGSGAVELSVTSIPDSAIEVNAPNASSVTFKFTGDAADGTVVLDSNSVLVGDVTVDGGTVDVTDADISGVTSLTANSAVVITPTQLESLQDSNDNFSISSNSAEQSTFTLELKTDDDVAAFNELVAEGGIVVTGSGADTFVFNGSVASDFNGDDSAATTAIAKTLSALQEGDTFTLTTSADDIRPDAPVSTDQTTTNLDTITGVIDNASSNDTVNGNDQIKGGEGLDTLKVSVLDATANETASPIMSSVETVEVTNEDASDAFIFNAFNVDDLSTVSSLNSVSSSSTTFDNLDSLDVKLLLDGDKGTTTALYNDPLLTGGGDEVNVEIRGASNAGLVVDGATTEAVETLNIESLGSTANTVNLDGSATNDDGTDSDNTLSKINVSGVTDIDLSTLEGGQNVEVDASELSGKLTVNLDVADDHTITGGAKADTVTTSADIDGNDTFNLGNGTDTITVTNASVDGTASTFQGIENVNLEQTAGGTIRNIDTKVTASASTLTVTSKVADADYNFTDLSGTLTGTFVIADNGGAGANDFQKIAVNGDAGTEDTVTVTLKNEDANTKAEITDTDGSSVETVNVTLESTTDHDGADLTIGALTGLTDYNVDGSADAEFGTGTAIGAVNFDASNATGDLEVTVAAANTTLKTGSGDDVVTLKAGDVFASGDTVELGDGTDDVVARNIGDTTNSSIFFDTTLTAPTVTGAETARITIDDADGSASAINGSLTIDATSAAAIADTIEVLPGQITSLTDATLKVDNVNSGQTVKFGQFDVSDNSVTISSLEVGLADDSAEESVTIVNDVLQDSSAAGKNIADVTAGGIETVTLKSESATAAVETVAYKALTFGAATTLNLTGDLDVTIDSVDLATGTSGSLTKVDASLLDGGLTYTTTEGAQEIVTSADNTHTINLGDVAADTTVTGNGTETVTFNETTSVVAPTLTNVETVKITPTSDASNVDVSNFENVGTIEIVGAQEGIKLVGLDADQDTDLVLGSSADFANSTVALHGASGVESVGVDLTGDTALGSSAIIETNTGSLSINDLVENSNNALDQTMTVQGVSGTPLDELILTGSGVASDSAPAVVTVAGGTHVSLETVTASGLNGQLDISGATLNSSETTTVTLNNSGQILTVAEADLADLAVTGGDGTDKIVVDTDVDSSSARKLSATNVETLDFALHDSSAADTTLNLTGSTIGSVELDLNTTDADFTTTSGSGVGTYVLKGVADDTDDIITLSSAADVTLTNESGGLAGDTDTSVVLSDATSATLTQSSAHTVELGKLTAANLQSLTIDGKTFGSDAITLGKGGLVADSLTSITVTGDGAVTVGDDTTTSTAALATFDASAATGNVTLGSGVELTNTAEVTTGEGNDNVTLSFNGDQDVTLDMGEKANDADTLTLTGSVSTGATVIDLTNTGDAITQVNGATNSTVQKNFESVDATALSDGSAGTGVSFTGNGDANTFVESTAGDTVNLGSGDDTYVQVTDTADDTVDAGAGSGDELALQGSADIDATGGGADDFANYSNFEKLTAFGATTSAIDFEAHSDFASDTGITTIDFSADTNSTGDNVIDMSNISGTSTAFDITGSAGKDTITGDGAADTINGGAGNDVLTGGGGADTFVFGSASTNGKDDINEFVSGTDKLDLDGVVGDVAGAGFVTFSGSANGAVADGSVVNNAAANGLADAAAAAALFEVDDGDDTSDTGEGSKMELADNATIVLVQQDDDATSSTDYDAQLFAVSSDGTSISAVQLAFLDNASDSSSVAFADIV